MATKEPGGDSPRKRDWRKPKSKSEAGSGPAWKESSQGSPPRQGWHGLKRWVVTLFALAAFAVLIWWLVPVKRTGLVIFTVADYAAPLPPNAWAVEDAARLQSQFSDAGKMPWQRPALLATTQAVFSGATDAAYAFLTERLRESAANRLNNTFVLYVSAHGVVDEANEPCLIVDAAHPTDPTGWLRVRDLMDWLHDKAPAAASLSGEPRFVLLLDSNRMHANIPLGLLHNDFAERLTKVVNERAGDNVAVINSTAPGQIGWASPKLQGSTFGHFSVRGLAGEADGDGDGQITLRELAAYLQERVDEWASVYRYDSQTPMLLPSKKLPKSFEAQPSLVQLGRQPEFDDKSNKEELAAERDAYADQALELWNLHEKLAPFARAGATATTPKQRRLLGQRLLDWERVQYKLSRWEQLYWAGPHYRPEAEQLRGELKESLAALDQEQPPASPAHGVALWEATHDAAKGNDLVQKAIDRIVVGGQIVEQELADLNRARKVEYRERAVAAWKWLRENNFNAVQAERLYRELLAAGDPPPSGIHLVEWQFAKLLFGAGNLPVSARSRDDLLSLALKVRDQAERSASPADERVAYALRPSVDKLDSRRRLAEDALFAGRDLDAAMAEFQALSDGYDGALVHADRLTAVYALRDRAYAWLPHLIEWSGRPLSRTFEGTVDRTALAAAAVKDLQEMEAALPDAASDVAALAPLVSPLERSLTKLRAAFDDSLPKGQRESEFARAAHDALAPPLVTGPARVDLRKNWFDALQESQHNDDHDGKAYAGTVPETAPQIKPPAARWLDLAAGDLHAEGDAIRQWLAAPPKPPAALPKPPATDHLRSALALIDLQVRRGAAWWAAHGGPTSESFLADLRGPGVKKPAVIVDLPYRRLANYDRASLLVWHARRAYADYWGSGDRKDGAAYFKSVVRDYSDKAGGASPGASPELKPDWGALVQAADRFVDGQPAVAVAPIENPSPPVQDQRLSLLLAEQNAQLPDVAMTPAGVWSGNAAIFAQVVGGDPLSVETNGGATERLPHRLPGETSAAGFQATFVGLPNEPKSIELETFFRGHIAIVQFTASPPEQPLVREFVRQKFDKPRVRLRGEGRGTVIFVLDCSGSMSVDNGVPQERLTIAKAELVRILKALAEAETYDVGLCFYAHRASWKKNPKGGYLHSAKSNWTVEPEDLFQPEDKVIRPGQDVQLVVPIGRLNGNTLQSYLEPIDKVDVGWGETPLYYAMCEMTQRLGAKELGAAGIGLDVPRHLVVITDGQDSVQTTPLPGVEPWDDFKPIVVRTADNVRASFAKVNAGGPPVNLFMIGVDLNSTASNQLDALSKSAEIEGKLEKVVGKDGKQMRQKLLQSLDLREYAISPLTRGAEMDSRVIGQWYNEREFADDYSDQNYLVRLLPAGGPEIPIRLEGGEKIELIMLEGGRRLAAPRFSQQGDGPERNRSVGGLLNPDHDPNDRLSPERLFATWHRPTPPNLNNPEATFFVSLQNDNPASFSPRPRETWVDIEPLAQDESVIGLPYRFLEATYVAGRPAPVLECKCPDWPASAVQARVTLWSRMKSAKEAPAAFPILSNPDAPRTIDAGTEKVRVQARRGVADDGSAGAVVEFEQFSLAPLRVYIPDFSPTRIVREYYPVGKRIVHRFEFGPETPFTKLLEKNAAVLVQPRDEWEKKAVRVELPIVPVR